MKNLILSIIIFLSSCDVVPAQVGLVIPVEVGQGFHFKGYDQPQWYSVNTTVKPSMTYKNLRFSGVIAGTFCNGFIDGFAGNEVGYKVYQPESGAFDIQVCGSALFGTHNLKLYGGGVIIEKQQFYLTLNARQEYTNKELWFDAGLGFNFINIK